MALKPLDAFCDGCGCAFTAVPKRTFIGFQKLTCPACQAELLYPLTPGYRVFYQFCAVSMGISFVASLAVWHHAMMPGLTGTAMLFGLFRDRAIRRDLKEAAEARAAIGTPAPGRELPPAGP